MPATLTRSECNCMDCAWDLAVASSGRSNLMMGRRLASTQRRRLPFTSKILVTWSWLKTRSPHSWKRWMPVPRLLANLRSPTIASRKNLVKMALSWSRTKPFLPFLHWNVVELYVHLGFKNDFLMFVAFITKVFLATFIGRVQDQQIAFKPDELEGQSSAGITQNMGALTMPCGHWNTKMTQIVWQARWTVNGLTPIRPVVVWNVDHTLDGKKCLLIE